MQVFWIIFYQEIILSLRNLAKIIANLLFFLISVTIFFLISQNQDTQIFFSISIIWFSLLSCLVFSSAEFLKKDFEDGTIEQIITSVDNIEIFVLAKMMANWFICALPIILASFPIAVIIGLDSSLIFNFLTLVFLATLSINFICTFCGSLSMLGNSAPMIGIISLPLIVPILLIAHGGLIYETIASYKILAGLCIFTGSILVFATAKIVTIAAE